jgi:hypothetical protein
MVSDQPNAISPCSFNRLPWAGGFELPGLCCSQAGDAVFQGNRDRGKYLSYLESANERYGAGVLKTQDSAAVGDKQFEGANYLGENLL